MKKSMYAVIVLVGVLIAWTALKPQSEQKTVLKKETHIVFLDTEVPTHKIKEVNGVAEVFLDSQDQTGQVHEINK